LVAISGLEDTEPSLLLGALIEISARLKQLPEARTAELKQKGLQALHARNAEKRSFNSWQRAQNTARFDLTQQQMQRLIARLGGKLPALEHDTANELNRLLRGL
jgi:hypothetical protein